eukprot:IDg2157t1
MRSSSASTMALRDDESVKPVSLKSSLLFLKMFPGAVYICRRTKCEVELPKARASFHVLSEGELLCVYDFFWNRDRRAARSSQVRQ